MKQYIVIALTLLFTVLSLNANAQTRLSKVNKQKHFAVKKPHNMDPAKAIRTYVERGDSCEILTFVQKLPGGDAKGFPDRAEIKGRTD